jgi:mRNA interferase HicA
MPRNTGNRKLHIEQKCSIIEAVSRRNNLSYRLGAERGSGSHGTLYLGDRFTVVQDLKKELGPGLLSDMLKQLGIRKEDL